MMERAAALSSSTGAADPIIGRVINGRFKVTALLARGGMGRVYRAEQAPLGRVCAIKVLDPHYAGDQDPEFHKRFFLEASVASKLTHPNTVTIFDYGKTEDDIYYMAMEYLEGSTLHRAIRDAGHFPQERVVHVARQICRALREAHSLGAIHRDLKPANIFLLSHGDEADFVKVLDFGLVKNIADPKEDLTQSGFFMGSPKYMAPEQIRGDRVDARADIYALGIILYEMITGKVPFDRPNSVNVLMAHVSERPPPLRVTNPRVAVSPWLEEVVARCIEKAPEKRFRSMDDLLGALKRIGSASLLPPTAADETPALHRASDSASGAQAVAARGSYREEGDAGAVARTPRTQAFLPEAPPSAAPSLGARSPRAAGSKAALLVAVVGALAVAASVAYLAVAHSHREATASGVGLTTPVFVAPAPSGAEAPAPLQSAGTPPVALGPIRVESVPRGATVREQGVELCSSTPCAVSYEGSAADTSKPHTLTIARPGYRAEERSVKAGDAPLLVRLTPAPPAARPAPAPPSSKDVTPPVPTGYKTDIPY